MEGAFFGCFAVIPDYPSLQSTITAIIPAKIPAAIPSARIAIGTAAAELAANVADAEVDVEVTMELELVTTLGVVDVMDEVDVGVTIVEVEALTGIVVDSEIGIKLEIDVDEVPREVPSITVSDVVLN